MKNRFVSVLLAIALICAFLPVGILHADVESPTDVTYPVEGGYLYFDKATGTIMDCGYGVTKANIPSKI